MITVRELLCGADEDVVANAYLAILGRWPDEGGLAHHLARIRDRPERRRAMLEEMAASEEARLAGRGLPPEGEEASGEQALAAQLRLRTAFLVGEVMRLRAGAPPPAAAAAHGLPPGFAEEQAVLAAEFDALKREVRARLAALEQVRAESLPAEPPAPPGLADYLLDLVEASEARMLDRLRSLERRAFGGGGAAGPPPAGG